MAVSKKHPRKVSNKVKKLSRSKNRTKKSSRKALNRNIKKSKKSKKNIKKKLKIGGAGATPTPIPTPTPRQNKVKDFYDILEELKDNSVLLIIDFRGFKIELSSYEDGNYDETIRLIKHAINLEMNIIQVDIRDVEKSIPEVLKDYTKLDKFNKLKPVPSSASPSSSESEAALGKESAQLTCKDPTCIGSEGSLNCQQQSQHELKNSSGKNNLIKTREAHFSVYPVIKTRLEELKKIKKIENIFIIGYTRDCCVYNSIFGEPKGKTSLDCIKDSKLILDYNIYISSFTTVNLFNKPKKNLRMYVLKQKIKK